jgi:hypothetical protein
MPTALARLQRKTEARAHKGESNELAKLKRTLEKCDGLYGYTERCEMLRARIAELEGE